MRLLISLLCLSLSLILAGCITAPEERLDTPALSVQSLNAGPAGYELRVRIINPNTVPLVISASSHTLTLGDERIGRIDDREPVGVPPLGGADHTIRITGKPADAVRAFYASKTSASAITVVVDSALEVTLPNDNIRTLRTSGRTTLAP